MTVELALSENALMGLVMLAIGLALFFVTLFFPPGGKQTKVGGASGGELVNVMFVAGSLMMAFIGGGLFTLEMLFG